MFKVCAGLEAIRERSPFGFQILRVLTNFAQTVGNNEKAIAELMSHPPTFVVSQGDVQYLIKNSQRIFYEPSLDDENLSRCRPPNERERVRITNKSRREIFSV